MMFSSGRPEGRKRSSALTGILFMLAGVTIFVCVNAFSKVMVATYPPAQIFFIRGFGAVAMTLPFLARDNFAAARNLPRPGLQFFRVMLSASDGLLFFTALKYIPLADATTCYLAAPIFVTAFSAIFLREHVGWRRWTAVAVGFLGVLIALHPTGATISWPALLAVGACLCQAVFLLVTRQLRGTSNIFLSCTQIAASCAVGGLLSIFNFVPPTWFIVVLLLISGIINICGAFCVNQALALAPASTVAPYQFTMIVWAIILGFFVFGDVPSASTLIGGAIVVCSGIYIFVRERNVLHREPDAAPPTVV